MPASLAAIKRLFRPGQTVTVTNHYITKPDHFCYGTKPRTITRVTSSHLHFEMPAGYSDAVPWPKAADVRMPAPGVVEFYGHPAAGVLWLTIRIGEGE